MLGGRFTNSPKIIWLVVWNMAFMNFPYIGNSETTDFHIFSEGWLNHQPVMMLNHTHEPLRTSGMIKFDGH
jgi:hypothetical protein